MPAFADPGSIAVYMKARAADAAGDKAAALNGYARVLAAGPVTPEIALRAYREALAAGDTGLERRALERLAAAGRVPADAALLRLGDAAAHGDAAAADAALAVLGRGTLAPMVPALQQWTAFAAKASLPPPPVMSGMGAAVAKRLADDGAALVEVARGTPAAIADPLGGVGGARAAVDMRIAAVELLLADGHADAAARLIPASDPLYAGLRREGGARPTLGFGISRLLARLAADLQQGDPPPLAISLGRAALRADPANARARLLLAEALARDGSTDRALAELARIPADDPFADAALAARVLVLRGADRDAEALAVARTGAARKGSDALDWQRYGDLLVGADQPAEAAPWYKRLLDARGERDDWSAWLQYGGALEQAGRWQEARPALERAVKLAPDEPLALNYLGYALVTRGEEVGRAEQLLRRASTLKPQDASITDSLGWAYFVRGEPARALPLIERAAAAEPDNAEIGEHLGDVYWAVGRRYEARYAWRAAALTAEPDAGGRLATKLDTGLPERR